MKITVGQRDDRSTASATILHKLAGHLDAEEQGREEPIAEGAYVQWGFKLTGGLQSALDLGLPYVIIDWGYFSDRENCISVSINGFHGLSMVPPPLPREARWHPHPLPWKDDGECVTVFGQLQNDRATRGLNVEQWLRDTAVAASNAYGLPAKIRPHPKMISSWEKPLPPLDRVLEETAVAVTWTSSVGILTVLAGVPTVAMHPASPAALVSGFTLGETVRPHRAEWLHDLSWKNYRGSELDEAAAYIKHCLPKAATLAMVGAVDRESLRV